MNLQQIMRVAVCAALIALGLVSAGLFLMQPAASQKLKSSTLHGAAALDQLKRDGQYESLQTAMNQARFSVQRTEANPLGRAAWHAPNATAGYDAYVTETGVSIIAKGAINDTAHVSLSLYALGYGAALKVVGPGKVSGDKQTINIARDGGLREWFVNGPDGLEHGFTLDEAPGARAAGVPLRLALQMNERWRAVGSEDGKRVTLRGPGEQAVEYGELVARDARGLNIPARLAVTDEHVVIEVEDHNAQYPLTIDPLFTLQQRLVAADAGVLDFLGYAVALDGNTALIGAPYEEETQTDQGAAYVFVRNGSTWTQQAKLFDPQGAALDHFGTAVALSGDTALIGAPQGDGGKGAAYVFVRNGTAQSATWTRQQKLTATDGFTGAQFGAAVALDGHTALIGAYEQAIAPTNAVSGAAYVFVRNGTSWTRQQRLLADDGDIGDNFGFSVALDGETALVGAPKNTLTLIGQGAAYIFTRAGTSWTQQQRLFTSPLAVDDNFGNSVALSGDRALVGASLYGTNDRGKAFIFQRTTSGWLQEDTLGPDLAVAGEHFGVAVALDGNVAVVGASLGLTTAGTDARSAYVFADDDGWAQVRKFGPELGAADDRFGYAVALDGDTVLIGAYRSSITTGSQGAAYAFTLHDNRHLAQPKVVANDGAMDDYFGKAVAVSGDTVAVGAPQDDIGANSDQGSIHVFVRNGTSWAFQQKLTASDGMGADQLGFALALEGDTLVAGAYTVGSSRGAVYVFTRSGTAWTQQPRLLAPDGAGNDQFGYAVALSGGTLLVGAHYDDTARGSAYVFTRAGAAPNTSWTFQQKLTASDGAALDRFGASVAIHGDTAAVGALNHDVNGRTDQGSAYVFTRSGTVWTQQPQITASDGAAGDEFGSAVALHGDTLAVGAWAFGNAPNRPGSVYIFARNGTAPNAAWAQRQRLVPTDAKGNDGFGQSVALSADLLVAGGYGATDSNPRTQGRAYVFTRRGAWVQQQKLTVSERTINDYFGWAVALSGDMVVVGAPQDDTGTLRNRGAAYILVSPPCPAFTVNPPTLPNGAVGAAYAQRFTDSLTGGDGPYPLIVSSGALPPGLTLARSTGDLTGTPTVAGTYRFTITATNTFSLCPGSRAYTLTITPPCPSIALGPVTLAAAFQGTAYNQPLTATGGTVPYSFARTAGALPPGLSLSAAGVLSGTPTQPGNYSFTIAATDANGCVGTRAYTLGVGCIAVTIAPPMLPGGAVGAAYNQTITAAGGAEPYRFTASGTLPPGLSLSLGGVLSGTPTQAGSFTFSITAQDNGVCIGITGYTLTITGGTTSGSLQFYPLPRPVRLLDTRTGATGCDAPAAMIAGNTSRLQTAAGRTCDGITIPASARALTGNITTVESGGGFLTLYPGDSQQPLAANSNYAPNEVLNNVFTVGLGQSGPDAGAFRIYVTSNTNIVVDVTGYYAPPAAGGLYFHPLPAPIRLLETRAGQTGCFTPGAPLPAGSVTTQLGQTDCGGVTIPADAQALVGNATTVGPQTGGYLTLYPAGTTQPLAASSNFQAGQVMNAPFTVGLAPGGQFNIFTTATTDLVIDVLGYYSAQLNDENGQGLLLYPLASPIRLLDTRANQTACFTPGAPLTPGATVTQSALGPCTGIPAAAKAVVGNATVVNANSGYLTFWPSDAAQPLIATSNFNVGQIFNRHFTVGLGADGVFKIFAAGTTDLVIDAAGFFAP